MVVASIAAGREADLRALLETMNANAGMANPGNAVLPFGEFDRVHYARLVILEDETMGDIAAQGLPVCNYPKHLVFMCDCDGPSHELLADMVQRAGRGLCKIFAHCEGFDERGDLLTWLCAHDVPVATNYVNWVGRTVRQVREESALQRALSTKVPRSGNLSDAEVQRVRRELVDYVSAEVSAGRLSLTLPATTPWGWQIKNALNAISIPLIGVITLPLTIVLLPLVLILLRRHEKSDVEFCPRPDPAALQALKRLEDHEVTNQFSALGSVKPGLFRRWLLSIVLWVADYVCRQVANRGHLGRIQTIHFARWVFIDNRRRMVFASSYDGGHEAYMDDFINKVAWGLNATFSHGVGWPSTDWLIKRGARRELKFKYFQRRHHIPSQVWYKAYPGLALTDLNRNHKIREGLERAAMSNDEALAWLKLL
ncbi:MAG TPA: hypothetical protein VK642_06245 [Burkholderiales bacterium]|nr:hypothetical protein [Burkholderiales bacterium]